jgi:NAD(P)-dependent dehydrogenase (short-subunit alcohol dehydrogenase family)
VALGPANVCVAAIAPGPISDAHPDVVAILNSPDGAAIKAQSPLGRVATSAECANAIVFLASPESHFHTGAILDLNGASYLRS